jgi:hypothetical protein
LSNLLQSLYHVEAKCDVNKRKKLTTFAWFAIATGYLLGFQYLAIGGYEWFHFQAASLGNGLAPKVANPPYIFAMLYPLALLPLRWGIFVYSFIAIGAIYLTHRLTCVNKWLLLFSYPTLRNLFYSQLDILSMLGVALGWWAVERERPLWLGVALVLLGVKPQATGILAILYLGWGWSVAALLIPSLVLLYSFLVYGLWVPGWIAHTLKQSTGADPFFHGGLGAYPWGLLAWLPLIVGYRIYSRKQAAATTLAATMLSMPYVGYYSVTAFFGLPFAWFTPVFALPLGFLIDLRTVLIVIVILPWLQKIWHLIRRG